MIGHLVEVRYKHSLGHSTDNTNRDLTGRVQTTIRGILTSLQVDKRMVVISGGRRFETTIVKRIDGDINYETVEVHTIRSVYWVKKITPVIR